ncbi:MAG: SxtJ family membrane protein [Prochlorococcus marinus CUG1439]|uniref:SxtJ family membrane protein n=1 Tax=Prochlorococcus sp. MIT 1314 TaxID=3096220 RepID=UPI001B0BCA25|nr:SxtJ family membrane protein [Prochlorococcus sp. MIT 1314]MCR8540498.1 SxtJ family membrane protein [Prochlorococcus marinus CUG1439]
MKQTPISPKKLREFGFLIGIGFPVIIGWIIPLISGHLFRFWSLWIGIPLFILGILKPRLLLYPYQAWMTIGLALGWINSRIILGLVFLLVLQPISIVMKVFGYDPLKKKKRNVLTYREIKENHKVDLTRIF